VTEAAETPADLQEEEGPEEDLLIQEGDIAADYLERLLDILDYDGDLDMDVEGERAIVAIIGEKLGPLVGRNGETLEALQELTRLAVYRETGVRSRLMLDIGGYRARRRAELVAIGRNAAERVKELGDPVKLAPMNPFERKVVHDTIAAIDGLVSESEGEEPQRRVVVLPESQAGSVTSSEPPAEVSSGAPDSDS
jgi:spoIIIJ-associated protein